MISLVALGVRESFPKLRLILILNTTYKDQIKNDSMYEGIAVTDHNYLDDKSILVERLRISFIYNESRNGYHFIAPIDDES